MRPKYIQLSSGEIVTPEYYKDNVNNSFSVSLFVKGRTQERAQ